MNADSLSTARAEPSASEPARSSAATGVHGTDRYSEQNTERLVRTQTFYKTLKDTISNLHGGNEADGREASVQSYLRGSIGEMLDKGSIALSLDDVGRLAVVDHFIALERLLGTDGSQLNKRDCKPDWLAVLQYLKEDNETWLSTKEMIERDEQP